MTLSDLRRRFNFRRLNGLRSACSRSDFRHPDTQRRDRLPHLFLMSDDTRLPDPVSAALALPRGSGVVLRHRDPDRRYGLAVSLRAVCAARSLRLFIAGDARTAVRVGAHGIHLAERDLRRSAVALWWARQRKMAVTAAVHSPVALRHAVAVGVDAVFVSPVFATQSHGHGPNLGVLRFTAMAQASPIPVFALGGIGAGNVSRLRQAGIAGIAGISGFAPARTSAPAP